MRERPDRIDRGLRRMGCRVVLTRIEYPTLVTEGRPFELEMNWVNRGVGRALRNYELELLLVDADGRAVAAAMCGTIETGRWIAGQRTLSKSWRRSTLHQPANVPLRSASWTRKQTALSSCRWRTPVPPARIKSAAYVSLHRSEMK